MFSGQYVDVIFVQYKYACSLTENLTDDGLRMQVETFCILIKVIFNEFTMSLLIEKRL